MEKLPKQIINTVLSLGQYVLYQIRELETPPPTPASITHYGTEPERQP